MLPAGVIVDTTVRSCGLVCRSVTLLNCLDRGGMAKGPFEYMMEVPACKRPANKTAEPTVPR